MRARLVLLAALWAAVGCSGREPPAVRGEHTRQPRDVALVLDTSGSMKDNDPDRMAIFAAKVLTDLLEPGDRVFVTPFPGRHDRADNGALPSEGRPFSTFHRWARSGPTLGPLPPPELKRRLDGLRYDGQVTIFQEPLEAALAAMDRAGGRGARALVLLSDGEPSRGVEYVSRVFRDLAPELLNRGIRAFGVMLGEGDTRHFEILARATGGDVQRVARPSDLVARFASIFTKILQTRVEPVSFQRREVETFAVQPFVKELIFLVPEGGPGVQVSFQEPRETWWKVWEDGRTFETAVPEAADPAACRGYGLCRTDDACAKPDGGWNRYSVFRVLAPRPGRWRVRVESSPHQRLDALLIQNYDLYLEVAGDRERAGWVGEANRFVARLVDGSGRPVEDAELFRGARYRFVVRTRGGDVVLDQELAPDDRYRMVYDFVPPADEVYAVHITLTNGTWLRRSADLIFRGVKEIRLHQREAAGFGSLVPWTDAFIETVGRGLNLVVPVWEPGRRRVCRQVDFTGSAPEALGVVFRLDNGELVRRYGARVVNPRGDPEFTIEPDGGGGYRADLCLEAERWSPGGDLAGVAVPVRSSSGREVTGTTELRIQGRIAPLPAVWARLPWWLLLELYIAAKLARGVVFWARCGLNRGCRVLQTMEYGPAHGAPVRTVLHPGPLGWHRVPVLPRLLGFPWYFCLSFVNFLRTAWLLLVWDHPMTRPTMGAELDDPRRGDGPDDRPLDPAERRRRIRLAWTAVFWEGLLFSIWSGPSWRPPAAPGRVIVVTRLNGRCFFARTDGRGRAATRWRRSSQSISIDFDDARFEYRLAGPE